MTTFTDKTVLVIDSGLYIHVAVKLAESFGTTLYFCPWKGNGFPLSKQRQIGTGIEGVERVYSLFSAAEEADLLVFTDVYWSDEITHFRGLGKPVWGSGHAEALELERWRTKELMKTLGMNVVPAKLLVGVEPLREYLAEQDRTLYVKGSATRGDFETFEHKNMHLTDRRLDKIARELGPRRETMEFVVEEHLSGCEFGYDGYCIDGRFGAVALYGPEDKDAGYCGRVCEFDELPDAIREPTLQLAPIQKKLGLRGFYSNEIRVADDGTPYLIDPAIRAGSPPSESYIELFDNWDEVIWAGAHGDVADLNPVARYVAQIVLKSEWLTDNEYLPVYYPKKIARWVKLHNYCVLDDEVTVVPQEFPEFGSVIGIGDTQKEAEAAALEHVEQIETLDLEWKHDVFNALAECLKAGRKVGIDF